MTRLSNSSFPNPPDPTIHPTIFFFLSGRKNVQITLTPIYPLPKFTPAAAPVRRRHPPQPLPSNHSTTVRRRLPPSFLFSYFPCLSRLDHHNTTVRLCLPRLPFDFPVSLGSPVPLAHRHSIEPQPSRHLRSTTSAFHFRGFCNSGNSRSKKPQEPYNLAYMIYQSCVGGSIWVLKMHLGTLGLKMGGLACLCFPGRRKVNPKDNAISDEQRDCKPPDAATTPTVQKVDNDLLNQSTEKSETKQVDAPLNTIGIGKKQREFSYQELVKATNNFRRDRYLGEGGFGQVYKGNLENPNQVVAVKKLNKDGLQGNKEFQVEITMLSLVCHPNIVTLIGYCSESNQHLLVYEFMPLGSLEKHLHDPKPNMKPLDWNTRMKIAVGTARGLDYLHNHCEPRIIYRDMKSANILLGEGYDPKISDLGLAKFGPLGDKSYVSTRVMGTMGYCAPEYGFTGHLTIKSDTYSFGVVLLELITGRQALDDTKEGGQYLIEWANPMLIDKRKYVKLADPRMKGEFIQRSVRKAVEVALMCMNNDQEKRPDMSEVVDALDFVASLSDPVMVGDRNWNQNGKSGLVVDLDSSDDENDGLKEEDEDERAKAIEEAKMWGKRYKHEAANTTPL
ncbi:unnamed protein product [Lactuca saligna]|uniref:Protein kinase domain-containing protein n=1 Tax=Lactuca saligna TaxID=75948 RepID=A0AA35YF84_LACSI|nr:unnamed protein product [Lactuca saligna]